MVCEDEAGFFAVLLPGKKIPSYTLIYWDGDGNQMEHYDPYAYPMQFTEQEQKQFENGICYSIYEKLGAHPVKIRRRQWCLLRSLGTECDPCQRCRKLQ